MKTRDKILETARELFNSDGVSMVSSRNISDAMNISYGNLCYHFPKKDDIIMQLYASMQSELDTEVDKLRAEIFSFDFFIRSLRGLLEVLYKYKFVFLDLNLLARKSEHIRRHARKQYQFRLAVCREIYDFLIREGYLKVEDWDGHYDMLAHSVLVVLNSWIMDAEIYYKGKEDQKIDYYLQMIYRIVSASLTKKGEDAFIRVYLHSEWRRRDQKRQQNQSNQEETPASA